MEVEARFNRDRTSRIGPVPARGYTSIRARTTLREAESLEELEYEYDQQDYDQNSDYQA